MNNREYHSELVSIVSNLPEEKRIEFVSKYNNRAHNPLVLFGINVFYLGMLGVDRFVLGQTLLGILKLITLGGLGIWILIDCFLIGSATRRKNIEIATAVADSLKN